MYILIVILNTVYKISVINTQNPPFFTDIILYNNMNINTFPYYKNVQPMFMINIYTDTEQILMIVPDKKT